MFSTTIIGFGGHL